MKRVWEFPITISSLLLTLAHFARTGYNLGAWWGAWDQKPSIIIKMRSSLAHTHCTTGCYHTTINSFETFSLLVWPDKVCFSLISPRALTDLNITATLYWEDYVSNNINNTVSNNFCKLMFGFAERHKRFQFPGGVWKRQFWVARHFDRTFSIKTFLGVFSWSQDHKK